MAYASLMSGICLAQTGLGSVHGLASPLGAYFPIPHGLCCGTLVAEATAVNIRALRERDPQNVALDKYAWVGHLLAASEGGDRDDDLEALVRTLRAWTERLSLARLGAYGMEPGHMAKVVAGSRGGSMKTNPIVLTDGEVEEVVSRRL
jgi:alcohol dehydrogenase